MKKILLLATCFSFFTAISYADEVEYYYKRVPIEYDENEDDIEYYYKKIPVKSIKKTRKAELETTADEDTEYTYPKVAV